MTTRLPSMVGAVHTFNYPFGSILVTDFTSDAATSVPFRRFRFRFWLFFVRMWAPNALRRRSFPLPVNLNRFAADRLVFIFGMILQSER